MSEKRYYRVYEDVNGPHWHFVAADIREVLRHLGDPGHGFDEDNVARSVEIRRLNAIQARAVRASDDNGGRDFATLADAPMGSVFCSEC